jgi:hypothetical protein
VKGDDGSRHEARADDGTPGVQARPAHAEV